MARALVAELQKVLPPWTPRTRLRLLPKQLALLALRTCCVPLVQHWLTTVSPDVVLGALDEFDAWVVRMLPTIMDEDSSAAVA